MITTEAPAVEFAWLELTLKCQLQCGQHCYAKAGPDKGHGQMRTEDWRRVIRELAELGARGVRFIGGEPTLYPDFDELVRYALEQGLLVEVLSNLARNIPAKMWELFSLPNVYLAVSYYSDLAAEHDRVTGVRGSHARTRASIAKAVRQGIPVRGNIVRVLEGQRVEAAKADLVSLGVTEGQIVVDKLREVGRGVRENGPGLDQLCGSCANARIAVSSDGEVWPCVFARWMSVGNVGEEPLADIIAGEGFSAAQEALVTAFHERLTSKSCGPDICGPDWGCAPGMCRP